MHFDDAHSPSLSYKLLYLPAKSLSQFHDLFLFSINDPLSPVHVDIDVKLYNEVPRVTPPKKPN